MLIKKIVSIIFILSILLTLCSCGKKEEKHLTEDGREIIVLAAVEGGSELDGIIADFNNYSTDYYIEQRNYVFMDNGLYTGNEKLIMDVTRGERIDILYNSGIDMEVYINKGLLTDLYQLIDSDGEVSRDTYTGAVRAFESGGRLCSMPTFYYMQTTIGKESVWQGDRDVSIEHLIEKAEELNAVPIANLTRNTEQFSDELRFAYYLQGTLPEYIDFENNTCNFTDGRFEQLLNFADMYDIGDENPDEMFAEGRSLLYHVTIGGFGEWDYYKTFFGPDIVFMGFPADTPNYHNVSSNDCFSILESSENKQGAFEFIKYITSYDYQLEETFGNFLPINREVYDFVASMLEMDEEAAWSRINADGVRTEYKPTSAGAAEVAEQLNTVSSGITYGETMAAIIGEEVGAFFSHDKTAAEVCDVIQNRISTYLSENAK